MKEYFSKIMSFFKKAREDFKTYFKEHKKAKIFAILSISLIMIFIVFSFMYNLYYYQKPKMTLEPAQIYLNMKNNENKTLSFNMSATTNILCDTTCEYSFIDRSTSTILQNGTFTKISTTQILVEGPKIGSGVKVYNLELTCQNKKAFFCPYVKDSEMKKSSFVVFVYELTENEKTIKEEVRTDLLNIFNILNQINSEIYQLDVIYDSNSFFNHDVSSKKYTQEKESITIINNTASIYYQLWNNQEFNNFSLDEIKFNYNVLLSYSENLSKIKSEIIINLNQSNDMKLKYNKYLTEIRDFTKENEDSLYINAVSSDIQFKYIILNKDFILFNNILTNSSNYSLNNGKAQLLTLEIDKNQFKENVLEFKDNISKLKNDSLNLEIAKRCDIGYCPELSEDFCSNVQNLILDSNFNRYNLAIGKIYLYNNSYYNNLGVIPSCSQEELSDENCIYENFSYKTIVDNQTILENLSNMNIINVNSSEFSINQNKITLIDNTNLIKSINMYCVKNENIDFSLKNLDFIQNQTLLNISNLSELPFKTELVEPLPVCCFSGICSLCCDNDECKNDSKTYPLLMIHGHSFLKSASVDKLSDMFNKIEYQLILDGYIDGGTLEFDNPQSYAQNWTYLNSPMILKVNYYYDNYYSLGSYIYVAKKDENIDNYAIRLSETIENVKKMTGRPKINVVAHSMGGLVIRRYMQIFGTNSIDKIILIGTPNQGVEGRVKYLCSVVGEKLECEDMIKDSILLSKLNQPGYEPQNVSIYTISGSGCDMSGQTGDGIVTLNSSLIPYAKEAFIINGSCTDVLKTNLHNNLLDIDKYPQVYENIISILNE